MLGILQNLGKNRVPSILLLGVSDLSRRTTIKRLGTGSTTSDQPEVFQLYYP